MGRVAGLDLSDVQVDIARGRLAARIAAGSAEIVHGDAAALPWPDGTFTVVTCVGLFETFPDPEKVLAKMVRVLRPGGRVVLNIGERVPVGTQTHRMWGEYGCGLRTTCGAWSRTWVWLMSRSTTPRLPRRAVLGGWSTGGRVPWASASCMG